METTAKCEASHFFVLRDEQLNGGMSDQPVTRLVALLSALHPGASPTATCVPCPPLYIAAGDATLSLTDTQRYCLLSRRLFRLPEGQAA